jgi:hypothetical protein
MECMSPLSSEVLHGNQQLCLTELLSKNNKNRMEMGVWERKRGHCY